MSAKDRKLKADLLYRLATSSSRALPDFIMIGVEKGGTTSLFQYLMMHPAVVEPLRKEPHYFSLHYHQGFHNLAWYRANFPKKSELAATTGQRRQTGESSTSYMFVPHAARRIQSLMPNERLIALLRNPIDRAYSQYSHQVRLGAETQTFEQAIEREMNGNRGALEAERVRQDANYYSHFYYKFAYCERGIYADQLPVWLETFPRDQLLILSTETMEEDTPRVLAQVLDYLHLPPWQPEQFQWFNVSKKAPLSAETRARLVEFFRPHNQRLYDLLQHDFGWDR